MDNQTRLDSGWGKLSKANKVVAVAVLVLFAVIMFYTFFSSNGIQQPSSKTETRTQQPQFILPAQQLMAEYDENEIAAKAKYENKIVAVGGIIGSIDTEITGRPFITIETGKYGIFSVQCLFERGEENLLVNLTKGQQIVLQGRVSGKLGNIIVEECTIAYIPPS